VDPAAEGLDRASLRAGGGVTDATVSRTFFPICVTNDGGGRGVENVERCCVGVGDDVVMGVEEGDVASAELLRLSFLP
jgi:hypothetical protein